MANTAAVFKAKTTTEATDDSAPVVAGDSYPAMQSVIVDTAATGTYLDINGRAGANSAAVSVRIPNGNANGVISAGAEITPAEFALVEIVTGEAGAAQSYDETSVAEYRVAWGGANGGTNASSSSVYVAPDDIITLEHDGDYTFDALPYQTCISQENGTATGGTFSLKTSTGSTIDSVQFPWLKQDLNFTNFPYAGGRQTIYRANMTAGTYRLGFISHAGAGGGNRVSYNGYVHVIVRRSSLLPSNSIANGIVTLDTAAERDASDADFVRGSGGGDLTANTIYMRTQVAPPVYVTLN